MLPRLQSGKIYPVTVLWVTCKDCGHTEGNDEYGYCDMEEFPSQLTSEGWAETDGGWICPECAKEGKK